MDKGRSIFFSYIKVRKFSGQSSATVLIKKIFADSNYQIKNIYLFAFDRSNSNLLIAAIKWIYQTLTIVPVVTSLLMCKKPILYINLGQGYLSFFRVIWWYFPLRILKWNLPVIISLHGHSFISWPINSFKTRLFRFILNTSKFITVLGPSQKHKLIYLGVSEKKILIVPNTFDSTFIDLNAVVRKQQAIDNKAINILYLSLLVESKGYPEYLEALYHIAQHKEAKKINAVLCGPIVKTAFCNRFQTIADAKEWIEKMIDKINTYPNSAVEISWINGAEGNEKDILYKKAQIFVLPTSYPNEAQPLVLLEAMAAGCSIITSCVGEITSTISEKEAILLKEINPISVATAMLEYVNSDKKRMDNAINGWHLVKDKYSIEQYKQYWTSIFEAC